MNLRRPFQFTEMKAAKPIFDASPAGQKAIYADAGFDLLQILAFLSARAV